MGFFRRIFGKKDWSDMPPIFVDELKRVLGNEHFNVLTSLGHKHKMFDQRIFQEPERFSSDSEFMVESFAYFLGSMGNQLAQHGHLQDAEQLYHISLTLKADKNPSHGSLAILYYQTDRMEKARLEAEVALRILEEFEDSRKDIGPIPEEIAPPGSSEEVREILLEIIHASDQEKQRTENEDLSYSKYLKIGAEEFAKKNRIRWQPNKMNLSAYLDQTWECAQCGHQDYLNSDAVSFEGGGMRLIISCSMCQKLTVVKVQGIVRPQLVTEAAILE